jgi:hypothetical protein
MTLGFVVAVTCRSLRSLSFFVSCTLASAIVCACTTTDPGTYIRSYGDAICARAVQCCNADDLAAFYQGSEASCRQAMSSRMGGGPGLVQYGIMRFDATAAERCLKRIRSAACSDLFAAPLIRRIPVSPSSSERPRSGAYATETTSARVDTAAARSAACAPARREPALPANTVSARTAPACRSCPPGAPAPTT